MDLLILPVIDGMSPKALEQQVAMFNAPSQSVHSMLLQHQLFASIEPTIKSEELSLCFFVMTGPKFDNKAKEFFIKTAPESWTKVGNNFLTKLSPLVKVPRLTTSNLIKRLRAATKKTAALLATTIAPSDGATIASK